MWSDLMQYDKLVLKGVISCQPMFNKLDELTLMSMVYELFEKRTYTLGQTIMS
jgi:imidazoleglycerol phosphate synthase glutamine amidotransferase subunit HisH